MLVASLNGQDITASNFLHQYGVGSKNNSVIAQCPACDGNLTLKAATSDFTAVHFSHSKQNTNCTLVLIKKRKMPHMNKFKKHSNPNLELRHKIANDNDLLLNIYIRCNVLSNWETGTGNLSVNQFCQLLILSIETKIWSLKELSIITLPYILVQLSDYPVQVAKYGIKKTKQNQFRFTLSPKGKKDKTKAFVNYFLHKNNTLTGEFIKGCNIPTPLVEKITPKTMDWYQKKISGKLYERATKILL